MPQIVNPIQIQKYLSDIDYPASKDRLLQSAKNNGGDENVMHTLYGIPDQKYDAPTDVTSAIGDVAA